jgi:hypothetical protein
MDYIYLGGSSMSFLEIEAADGLFRWQIRHPPVFLPDQTF